MSPDATQALRDMLRTDAAPRVVGILVVAIGVGALLQAVRRASKDHGLGWFGLLAILYGTRLLLGNWSGCESPGRARENLVHYLGNYVYHRHSCPAFHLEPGLI